MQNQFRNIAASLCAFGLMLSWGQSCPAKEAAKPSRLNVTNVVQLKQLVGQDVTVYGKISRTSKSKSGHHFLNFYSSELAVICFKSDLGKFKAGGPADIYRNKDVELSGRLELFKRKLQIKLHSPSQIKLAEAQGGAAQGQPTGVKLRQLGKDSWMSPAGLRYTGRDPQGLTRVEHVVRHVQDQPRRDGPHGVFDGGQEVAFAVIDEAWKLAKKKKSKPQVEGDRSSHLVAMGRRVGYLGGRTGKQRGNPPLYRVFIVFKTGTKDIVTAFPR